MLHSSMYWNQDDIGSALLITRVIPKVKKYNAEIH